jgi:histidinol-phosphate/aromatic aminotransferase/cobyric acid decarboxylase-like protein
MERQPASAARDRGVPEVLAIDGLEEVADAYRLRHGRSASKLSHWDPSDAVVERLRARLRIPTLRDPLRYRFSYQLGQREQLLTRLGYSDPSRRVLVTENGTCGILAAANALALLGVRQVALLAPCYFAAKHALQRLGIEVRIVHWLRCGGQFRLPPLRLLPGEALWLENPIFNTGCSGFHGQLAALTGVLERSHYIVADNALAVPPDPLGDALGDATGYIAVHAPHKALCVNGLKFGAVSFHNSLYELFDHWSDIFNGGLSLSAEAAMEQFLSPEYQGYASLVSREIDAAQAGLLEVVAAAGDRFELDRATSGYWRTVYVPDIPAAAGEDLEWIGALVEATGAIFIPGTRAAFDPVWGFCFRVNLLRLGPTEKGALRRLLRAVAPPQRHRPAQ